MPHRVYRFPTSARAKMEEALGDDILSRQSLTVRDARHFGVPGDYVFLFVEGEEKGMIRADAVLLDIGGERAPGGDALYEMLKQEEDAAASGLGSVFGDV